MITSRINTCKRWRRLEEARDLVFGHNQMLNLAFYQFCRSVREFPFIYDLLPRKFTLYEFSNFWKQILGIEIDETVFFKKMLQKRVLVLVEEKHKKTSEKFYKLINQFMRNFQVRILFFDECKKIILKLDHFHLFYAIL